MQATTSANTGDRLCRKREVIALTGLSETTIWRREQEGRFPPRIRLGLRMSVWRYSDVNAWLSDPVGYTQEGGQSNECA